MQTLISLTVWAVIFGMALGQTSTTVAPKVLMPEITKVASGSIGAQIFGGSQASLGNFPWQASIFITKAQNIVYFCGGSLIDKNWILTAGHCTIGALNSTVRLGSLNPTTGGTAITSNQSYTHVSYNPSGKTNDIGLIKLSSPATLSANINVIKILPRTATCGTTLRTFNISGWGKVYDEVGALSSVLMKASVVEYSSYECLKFYGAVVIAPTVICAKGAKNESVCTGDSGGAVVLPAAGSSPAYQVGIVSLIVSPKGCGFGHPQGYTRTTMYLDWMQNITGIAF